jgi:hypothetical protein
MSITLPASRLGRSGRVHEAQRCGVGRGRKDVVCGPSGIEACGRVCTGIVEVVAYDFGEYVAIVHRLVEILAAGAVKVAGFGGEVGGDSGPVSVDTARYLYWQGLTWCQFTLKMVILRGFVHPATAIYGNPQRTDRIPAKFCGTR